MPATRTARLRQWKQTQSAWDDHDFLENKANAFMKLRWRRLNARAARACAAQAKALGRRIELVDVGCAHADFFDWARPSLRSYTGVEPSKALLKRDSRQVLRFDDMPAPVLKVLRRGQAEKLPLAPACCDFVLIKEVLDHCYDPEKVLSEAARVLRPGGRLLITLTNDRAWYKRLLPGLAGRIKGGQHDHLFYFHPSQVKHLARAAGFAKLRSPGSHYLRLPNRAEEILGRLPFGLGWALISFSDLAGRVLWPGGGGSFWVQGVKPN